MAWHRGFVRDRLKEIDHYKYDFQNSNAKVRLDVSHAVQVHVRANVMDIVSIDSVKETFTAIFTLHFCYIDPSLRDSYAQITYIDDDGLTREVEGQIWESFIYHNRKTYLFCERGASAPIEIAPTRVLSMTTELESEDSEGEKKKHKSEKKKHFTPCWTMMNVYEEPKELVHQRSVEYWSKAGGHVFEKFKYQATFYQKLHLHSMPFDKQCLTMKFVTEKPTYQLQFLPLSTHAGTVKAGATTGSCRDSVPVEWKVLRATAADAASAPVEAQLFVHQIHNKLARSSFVVVVHLERNPSFYIWNVVIVLYFLSLMAGFAVSIPPDQFSNRMQVLSTLLMTTVGYKIITSSWLPVKPYLTVLDKYILASFAVQLLVIIESFVIGLILGRLDNDWTGLVNIDSGLLVKIDYCFYIALFGLWTFAHIIFLVLNAAAGRCLTCKAFIPGFKCMADKLGLKQWDSLYEDNNVPKEGKREEPIPGIVPHQFGEDPTKAPNHPDPPAGDMRQARQTHRKDDFYVTGQDGSEPRKLLGSQSGKGGRQIHPMSLSEHGNCAAVARGRWTTSQRAMGAAPPPPSPWLWHCRASAASGKRPMQRRLCGNGPEQTVRQQPPLPLPLRARALELLWKMALRCCALAARRRAFSSCYARSAFSGGRAAQRRATLLPGWRKRHIGWIPASCRGSRCVAARCC